MFRGLVERVPLETFQLFSSALAVHWETGGSLAPILANVGRTIRDRIEISRRVQSNIAQSQVSTVAVLGLTYFIAVIVWRTNPGQTRLFLSRSSASGWWPGRSSSKLWELPGCRPSAVYVIKRRKELGVRS